MTLREMVGSESDPEFRRTYIGGSDAAPIVGLGTWGSPYSVWLDKTGQAPERDEPSERMRWGTLLEQPIAEEWARREGVTQLDRATFQRMSEPHYVGGHPDFLAVHPVDGLCVVEIKVSDRRGEWEGEDGDEVPVQYYLQVQHYLMTTGIGVGYLVVLLRGAEMRSYRLVSDPKVHSGLLAAYAAFWASVESGEAPEPDGHEATAQAIKARYPSDDGSEIIGNPIDALAVERLVEARKVKREAEAEEVAASNVVKDRMGNSTRLLVPGVSVSWKQNRDSTRTNWEAIAKGYQKAVHDAPVIEAGGDHGDGRVLTDDVVGQLDVLESIHTDTVPGARVLRVTAEEE